MTVSLDEFRNRPRAPAPKDRLPEFKAAVQESVRAAALTRMAVEKISEAIQRVQGGGPDAGQSGGSEIDKAKEFINLVKGMIKK